MHGRLKVRTTEEQQLIKQKEQQKKLEAYRRGMKVITATRHEQPYNKTSFAICAEILMRNPDIYTLWNYRKEVAMQEIARNELTIEEEFKLFECEFIGHTCAGTDVCKEFPCVNEGEGFYQTLNRLLLCDSVQCNALSSSIKKRINEKKLEQEQVLSKFMEMELQLTEQCLIANPKSYGAWHHRYWILERHPRPNWDKELALCTKYLSMDDRNFHVWDYRRLILNKLGFDLAAEIAFSTDRINVNFSNYSSWHYRSTLRELDADTLENELKLVQNAVFTDPYDSSTWFYLRWVLSNKAFTEEHRQSLINDFTQLQELEPDCKWIHLAKCWINGSFSLSNKDEIAANVETYRKLIHLDAIRKGVYDEYAEIAAS